MPNFKKPVMVKVSGELGKQDADVVADLEVVLLCGAQVHRDIVRGRRGLPLGELEGGELLFGIEGDADRRPSVADGIAVRHVLGVAA